MNPSSRTFATLIALFAIVWHVMSVITPAWVETVEQKQARDFASYYYAVEVAQQGGDAYDKAQLNNAARLEGIRQGVHPFLYAPPFLLGMAWVRGFDLATAYHLWFWVHEALAVAAAIALWRWWRGFSPWAGVVIAVLFGLMTAIPNNHTMGQANFPGLLLSILGLWAAERGKPQVGGALMGAACMLKMSPALFVVWWLVRREWVAVAWSVGTAVVLSLLSLPYAGPAIQLEFYTKILPQFSSGAYNGLAVPISLFGNHSIPNVLDQIWPGTAAGLSTPARVLSSAIGLALVGWLAWLFRDLPKDRFTRAAQASAFGVLLLLLPVYTYEHHLVFALPAAVISVLAVERGRIGPRWVAPIGLCVTVLLFDLQILKAQSTALPPAWWLLAGALQEAKFFALLGLLAITAWLGRGPPAEERRPAVAAVAG
jgi:hypothetical protein